MQKEPHVTKYAKAGIGFVIALLGALYAVSGDGITLQELIGATLTGLATSAGVFAVPNAKDGAIKNDSTGS